MAEKQQHFPSYIKRFTRYTNDILLDAKWLFNGPPDWFIPIESDRQKWQSIEFHCIDILFPNHSGWIQSEHNSCRRVCETSSLKLFLISKCVTSGAYSNGESIYFVSHLHFAERERERKRIKSISIHLSLCLCNSCSHFFFSDPSVYHFNRCTKWHRIYFNRVMGTKRINWNRWYRLVRLRFRRNSNKMMHWMRSLIVH